MVEYLTTVSVFTFSPFPLFTTDNKNAEPFSVSAYSMCMVAYVDCVKFSLKTHSVASFYSGLSSNDQTVSDIIRPRSMSQ